jgi:uncharacterized membrane protein (GlpM family)
MGDGDTVLNAVIGALVSTVLSGVLPFAPLVGGGVAGYLQGGSRTEGVRVGAISGLIAVIPVAVVFTLVFSFVTTVLVGTGEVAVPALFGFFFAVVALFVVVSVVGLSAAGGWVGNYVRYETDVDF